MRLYACLSSNLGLPSDYFFPFPTWILFSKKQQRQQQQYEKYNLKKKDRENKEKEWEQVVAFAANKKGAKRKKKYSSFFIYMSSKKTIRHELDFEYKKKEWWGGETRFFGYLSHTLYNINTNWKWNFWNWMNLRKGN